MQQQEASNKKQETPGGEQGTGGVGPARASARFFPRVSSAAPHPAIQRTLVIGPSNIGDAILALGVIEAVHRAYPAAHLTVVVGERAVPLFAGDPRIQVVVDTARFETVAGRLQLALILWRYRPQVVVDLRHTFYPLVLKPLSVWRYLRQPPRSIRHMRDRHLWTLRAQTPRAVHARFQAAIEAASPDGERSGPAVRALAWASARDADHVASLWRRWQLDRARYVVVICPGARSHIKRWVPEGFAAAADRLIAERQAEVVFSGEPAESPVVEAITALMTHRAHSAVGLVTMRQAGLLMRRADLVITNDSASLHLASAVEAPTLAIFGPTDEAKYGPTAARARVIRRRLFCAPCEQPLCRFSHECMRCVTAEEVYTAADALLTRKR